MLILFFQRPQPSETDSSRHKQPSFPFFHSHLMIFPLFGQVPLAHGHVVVDGSLHPPHTHAILIAFDAVVDLLAAGVQGHRRYEIPRVVPQPMRHNLGRVRRLTLFVCQGRCALGASTRRRHLRALLEQGERLSESQGVRRLIILVCRR